MPVNPNIALSVQTPPPPDVLGSLARVLQAKGAMAQQALIPGQVQLQQQEVDRGALQLKNLKDIQDAYAAAKNPDGSFDTDKLKSTLGATPGGLDALTHIGSYEKQQADIGDAKAKLDLAHRNAGGSLASAVDKIADPAEAAKLFVAMTDSGLRGGTLDRNTAGPFHDLIQQGLQQDPTGAAIEPKLRQITGILKQNAPEERTLATAAQSAAGTAQRGAAAMGELDLNTQKQANAETDRAHVRAVGQLAGNPPPDSGAYAKFLLAQPPEVQKRLMQTVPVEEYDPAKSPGMLNQSAMTPEQRFNANKPLAQRNPTEAELALQVAKGKQPGASAQDIADGNSADAALKRLDQSKLAARPNINVNMTPDQAAGTAAGIAAGKFDPATTRAILRRQPGLMGQVLAADPKFDEADIDKRFAVNREFASSSTSKAGGQVLALNTLIHHADLYQQVGEALNNGTFEPGNAAYNAVASMMGSAPPKNAALVARFLAGETGKVATGGVPAEGEINGILTGLKTSASPQSIKQAGETLLRLAGGRMIPLMEKVKDANLDNIVHVLGPDAQEILKRRGFDPATMKPVAAATSGGVQAIATKAQRDALPSGAQYTKPGDPNVYTKQ